MDRVFLDADVLFSATYRSDSGLLALWRRAGASLLTSAYAVDEARRNLSEEDQRQGLEALSTLSAESLARRILGLAPGTLHRPAFRGRAVRKVRPL